MKFMSVFWFQKQNSWYFMVIASCEGANQGAQLPGCRPTQQMNWKDCKCLFQYKIDNKVLKLLVVNKVMG